MKKLVLHTLPEVSDVNVEVGDEFEVVAEEEIDGGNTRLIIFVEGNVLSFTTEEDEQGLSVHDWFTVVEEEEN